MEKTLKIHPDDNVLLALQTLPSHEHISTVDGNFTTHETIASGHKVANQDIRKGDNVTKFGFPIGHATENIYKGSLVNSHNLKTNLAGELRYTYEANITELPPASIQNIMAYERSNGDIGIRNDLWVIPCVGCVNKTAEKLAAYAEAKGVRQLDSAIALTHPFGCSQLGKDHVTTQQILAALVNHPNAGGVLVVSLGCENNTLESFKKQIGDYDENRVKFMITQKEYDELETGKKLIDELCENMKKDTRSPVSFSKIKIGLKCGASDGFSGVTANPLLGAFSDHICAAGATSILTEVPEMFGAEQLLMERCISEGVFDKCVKMINDFKEYFISHKQQIYENPSPGNKKGGITTLEEKSLGCTQKGGISKVVDVLPYAGKVKTSGLNLLSGPGNDIVAVTALAAAGAHIVLFTTGRGTPLGGPIPTVKISTNTQLSQNKKNWIDFNAGSFLEGVTMDALLEEFIQFLVPCINGKKCLAEKNSYQEISIFKDGITL